MYKLFALCILLSANIYACSGGYTSCIKKVKDSHTVRGKSLYIPVKNGRILLYSPHKPNTKILKYDPFLSLYLIKEKKKFSYPFDFNTKLQLSSALVTHKQSRTGKIVKNQVGLNYLARYSKPLLTPSLLTSSCCTLEGIATPNGIIQKEYIQRFLSSAPATYADIGIRVVNEKGRVIVSASNPYWKDNLLQKGDCVVEFDGKKIYAASVFMRKVLFSKIASKHSIKIKRGSKFMTFSMSSQQRYGGGIISDTFLEEKGIYFNHTLQIIKLTEKFIKYGLIIGDTLLQVNGVSVKNQEELLNYIENFQDFSALLFEREGFQFFVNIK